MDDGGEVGELVADAEETCEWELGAGLKDSEGRWDGCIPSPSASWIAAVNLGPETVRIGAPTMRGVEVHGNHCFSRAASGDIVVLMVKSDMTEVRSKKIRDEVDMRSQACCHMLVRCTGILCTV